MTKKKVKSKSKKKLTKRLTKQLKQVIKVHGADVALGFVTGLVTHLIAGKTKEPNVKKGKKVEKETAEPSVITAAKKTTRAVAAKVKDAVIPKAPIARKTPVRKSAAKPVTPKEASQE